MTGAPLVRLAEAGGVATLTLARPARHNALVPDLVERLRDHVEALSGASHVALVLAAEGASFSTGGDVAGFAALARGERRAYAERLVGALHAAILALIDLPFPTVARVQGPVTGGALGLVLACDLVAMSRDAFLAPYYVAVGFPPDGGWTALLPERIGPARAGAIQLLNRHVAAEEAAALGIATAAVAAADLDATLDGWIAALRAADADSVRATRELLMPPERRAAVVRGLDREKQRFLDMIDGAAVEAGMRRFLERRR